MNIKYRPEIDGLRAIAVASVVLYHAQFLIFDQKQFQGGFIGVDIFFVISGYLITSIIYKELIVKGSFSFKHFYERRIRRILPALLLVMLASVPLAWIFFLPSNFTDYAKSILYSLGFTSNFYFHYSGQEYGAASGLIKPFLHTWSLSVEEQYYILFPIFFIFSFIYFRKHLFLILAIGFILSLFLADWGSRNHPQFNFYILPTRGWELLAGSILAYSEIASGKRSSNKTLNILMPTLGLLLIIHAIFFFNDEMYHPSFFTLSPIIGVCLIIWFASKGEFVTNLLTTKLFVNIGLISYSLYLWHYPIFVFLYISGLNSSSILSKIFAIVISIFLSILSYYFIETPARNKNFKFSSILLIIGFSIVVLISLSSLVIQKNGFPERFEKLKKINTYYDPDNISLGQSRLDNVDLEKNDFIDGKYKILIIGDSHGADLFNALSLNSYLYKNIDFLYVNSEHFDDIDNKILEKSDQVIISSWWINKFPYLRNNIDSLKKFNSNIFIASNTNEYLMYSEVYTILDHEIIFNQNQIDYFGLKNLYYSNRIIHSNSNINLEIKEFTNKENLGYLNKEDYMCNLETKECQYVDNLGNKLMYDKNHYTFSGAKFFGKRMHEINWLKIETNHN